MKFNSFFYSIKQGLKSISRNRNYSLASTGTIVACLFLLGIFLSLIMNFNHIMNSVEQGVAVTVYFDEDVSAERITAIGKDIAKKEFVDHVEYVSAEDAWKEFSKDYLGGKSDLLNGFGDENPLANSANYKVYLSSLKAEKAVVKELSNITGVRSVNSSETTIKNLMNLSKLIGIASCIIIIILLLVSIFLISNTVVTGISIRKEEISIMKLLGATDFFVRAPFVVEGVVIGFIGAAIPIVLLFFMYFGISSYIQSKFADITQWMTIMSAQDVFIILAPVCLGLGIIVGFFGSFLTVRKHLSV